MFYLYEKFESSQNSWRLTFRFFVYINFYTIIHPHVPSFNKQNLIDMKQIDKIHRFI